jgi:hypothetical protein
MHGWIEVPAMLHVLRVRLGASGPFDMCALLEPLSA